MAGGKWQLVVILSQIQQLGISLFVEISPTDGTATFGGVKATVASNLVKVGYNAMRSGAHPKQIVWPQPIAYGTLGASDCPKGSKQIWHKASAPKCDSSMIIVVGLSTIMGLFRPEMSTRQNVLTKGNPGADKETEMT